MENTVTATEKRTDQTSSVKRKTVCVQGLGFVGAANAIAIASARGHEGQPLYEVVGVDLPNDLGRARVNALSQGTFPFETTDEELVQTAQAAAAAGNLTATTDDTVFADADVVVVDVGLDLDEKGPEPSARLGPFEAAIRTVGHRMKPDALVLLESTVPPGTCELIVEPLLRASFRERSLQHDRIDLGYCYERVMPGRDYLGSVTRMPRVYAGFDAAAADAVEDFLSGFIDVEKWPLTRLSSLRAAEMSKVLENTYRALNIALIDEWERFARRIDVDLFEVLEAIRVRPTHNNIRYPGLGVGGYCLSKDPLFALVSSRHLYEAQDLQFPLSEAAVSINDRMPTVSANVLRSILGDLAGRRILILGASYRPDVADTRFSPTGTLAASLLDQGAAVEVFDPLATRLEDVDVPVRSELPSAKGWDAVVLAVAHPSIRDIDFPAWAGEQRPVLFDSNGILSRSQLARLQSLGFQVAAIGRGALR